LGGIKTKSEPKAGLCSLAEPITYGYDEVGNRMEMRVGGSTTYTYDSMNRLTSATGMTFNWDRDGNLLYKGDGDAWNYTYDPEGRMTTVWRNGAVHSRFGYDADGRRVRLNASGQALTHVYSGLDVIYEDAGGVHTRHLYANGLHIAENRSGSVEYFHQDRLGSTRLKTDSTGADGLLRHLSFKNRLEIRLFRRLGRTPW